MPANDGIGKIDPKRREEFEEYYQVRAEQMEPYITNTEETEKDLQPPPTIIYKAKPKEKPEQSNRHFAEMRKPLTEFTVLRNTEQKVETQSNTQISRQI
jgi:hypothetical protein